MHLQLWIFFNLFIAIMLLLDLFVFHRRAHRVGVRESLGWSLFWVTLALLFNLGVYGFLGEKAALEFLTGYLIEKSLSIDNLFVFLAIFSYFKIAPIYQHKVLFWGILGAVMMRGVMIIFGVTLLSMFHWIIYIFGIFILITGIKLALQREQRLNLEKKPLVRLAKYVFRVAKEDTEGHFFVTRNGKIFTTQLFLTLVIIEVTDLIFAVDSIPAVIAVSKDPFIIYTSNIFAILGLRSLYFALSHLMGLFHYLKLGLSAILVLVGLKMLTGDYVTIPVYVSLLSVVLILLMSIGASLLWPPTKTPRKPLGV